MEKYILFLVLYPIWMLLKESYLGIQFLHHNLTFVHWSMDHHCSVSNKITRLHGRCLRIVYSDNGSFFQDFINKQISVPINSQCNSRSIEHFISRYYKIENLTAISALIKEVKKWKPVSPCALLFYFVILVY